MKSQKKHPDIVSVQLSPETKVAFDRICDQRGMTIKSLLGRLIEWFNSIDRTEQSIVLGQIEHGDVPALAEMLVGRRPRGGGKKSNSTKPLRAVKRTRR